MHAFFNVAMGNNLSCQKDICEPLYNQQASPASEFRHRQLHLDMSSLHTSHKLRSRIFRITKFTM